MSFQTRLTVWLFLALSTLMMLLAIFAIPKPAQPNVVLGKALLAAGMALAPLGAVLPRLTQVPYAWLLGLVICESAAVVGVAAHAVAGLSQAWMLPLLGLCGVGLLMPQKDTSL